MQTKNEKPKDEAIVKLMNVRLSYPQLWTAKAQEEGKEPKFSASFLLNKKQHAELIKQIETLIDRAALDFFKKKVKLAKCCLRDGAEKEDKEGYGDEVMFLTASDSRRPAVVDRDKSPLVQSDGKPYAGCYVNAGVRLFAYDHPKGGKGVSASLRWVQFAKDGDSFGAAPVDVDSEIEEVTDDVDNY